MNEDVRFENYPREDEAESPEPSPALNRWENPPPQAVVRRYDNAADLPAPGAPVRSRRGLIAGVAGLGIAAVGGLLFLDVARGTSTLSITPGEEVIDEDPGVDGFSLGDRSFDLPPGWRDVSSDVERVVLANGRNRLVAAISMDVADTAAAQLRAELKNRDVSFSGQATTPKVTEVGGLERATSTVSGTFQEHPARQVNELLLDTTQMQSLFISQVLTAAPGSSIAKAAARLAADIKDGWPS